MVSMVQVRDVELGGVKRGAAVARQSLQRTRWGNETTCNRGRGKVG